MSQKRIYVAADEPLLKLLVAPLSHAGLMVVPFTSATSVIRATMSAPPDALLLRLNLIDGTALTLYASLPQSVRPPAVVILRPSQVGMKAELLAAGIRAVAVAPLRPSDLAEQLFEVA